MNKTIKIFTNHVEGGWSPNDLERMLGGSEESVVLLSEALVRKEYEVIVYHTKVGSFEPETRNDVTYLPRDDAGCNLDDIFITFKDRSPWENGARAKINIHWSAEVERPWDTSEIAHFVNLSPYHQSRNLFVPSEKSKWIPLGVDILSLGNLIPEICQLDDVLYCSSPDRGLFQLINDWPKIKEHNPQLKLKIAYGFDLFDRVTKGHGVSFKNSILKQLDVCEDLEFLGTLNRRQIEDMYWECGYWILPLYNPDSELFCLNALKAQYCDMTPIVNKIGALKNTVGSYIPYPALARTKISEVSEIIEEATIQTMSWDDIVNKYWLPLFED